MAIATSIAISDFENIVKKHTAKVGNAKNLLAQMEKIKNTTPAVFDEEKIKLFLSQRGKALTLLLEHYMVAQLSEAFPMLDDKIFNMKRHLYFSPDCKLVEDRTSENKSNLHHVTFPLFLRSSIGLKRIEIGKLIKRTKTAFSTEQKTIKIDAKVPDLPPAISQLGNKARGTYFRLIGDMYHNPIVGDIMVEEDKPTFEIMWIPTPESLNITVSTETTKIVAPTRIDPALLLKYKSRFFVVGLWDIKDELPFEGILREFSIGSVKFPSKVKIEEEQL